MLVTLLISLALLDLPTYSQADRALLATADRIAHLVPGHDEKLDTLLAVATRAHAMGDLRRAHYLVADVMAELPSIPRWPGETATERSSARGSSRRRLPTTA